MQNNEETEAVIQKHYEIAFLAASEDAAQELVSLLKRHHAEITQEGPLKRIRLAYKIKKETQAHFGFLQFRALPDVAKALEQELRTKQSVLRFLVVKLPKTAPRKVNLEPFTKPSRPVTRTTPLAKPVVPALSNEALEKKIEEILQ